MITKYLFSRRDKILKISKLYYAIYRHLKFSTFNLFFRFMYDIILFVKKLEHYNSVNIQYLQNMQKHVKINMLYFIIRMFRNRSFLIKIKKFAS